MDCGEPVEIVIEKIMLITVPQTVKKTESQKMFGKNQIVKK